MRSLRLPLLSSALALLATSTPLFAQVDATVDTAAFLKELHSLKDKQTTQIKTQRQSALQTVNAAAASPDRAVALWEDAIRAVQFDGVAKENAAFKDWQNKEGDGLLGAQARNAARLYFVWLGLTIQRDGGTPVKDLLPQIVAYTKDLSTDEDSMEAVEEDIWRDKDAASTGRRLPPRRGTGDQIKRMHERILHKGLAGSAPVQWLKLGDLITVEKWENNPGDLEGIYNKIILPELRALRDPRVLEYWDLHLKKEGDAAIKTKLAFELDKFNNQRRPALLWSRAEDEVAIGQKKAGLNDMLNLIRSFPQHPDAENWVAKMEEILTPPPPTPTEAVPGSDSTSVPPQPAGAQSSPAVVK